MSVASPTETSFSSCFLGTGLPRGALDQHLSKTPYIDHPKAHSHHHLVLTHAALASFSLLALLTRRATDIALTSQMHTDLSSEHVAGKGRGDEAKDRLSFMGKTLEGCDACQRGDFLLVCARSRKHSDASSEADVTHRFHRNTLFEIPRRPRACHKPQRQDGKTSCEWRPNA